MKTLFVAIAFLTAALPAMAEEAPGTLDKIRQSGAITLGVREASVPLSYMDAAGQPHGYNVDICLKIVDAVKGKLGLPKLQVNYQTVTAQTRIPLLTSGTVDMDCGTTSITGNRELQLAFTPPTYASTVRMAVAKASGITGIDQLNGKTVVTTAGTTSVTLLHELELTRKLSFRTVYGKDHQESFAMLAKGAADAMILDDFILLGEMTVSGQADRFAIVGESLKSKHLALMFRSDSPEFDAIADHVVETMASNGELAKLYDKWFNTPIPPNGVKLNLPMNDEMRLLTQGKLPHG